MSAVQDFDTLWVVARGDSGRILVPHHADSLAQWVTPILGALGLALGVTSARWAAIQWRVQHFTEEWAKTVQFLFDHPQFLGEEKNRNYKATYQGEELHRYELAARLSLGYVDDLHHLAMGKYLKTWLRGSIRLFVFPHRQWFEDHRNAYSEEFVGAITKALNDLSRET